MSNMGFTCDVCGRTVQGTTFVNGMKFCAKCYQDTFGNKFVDVTINNKSITEISNEVSIDSFLEQENKVLKKALYLACNYITRIVDKDVNKLSHEWAKHFIDQAKESLK